LNYASVNHLSPSGDTAASVDGGQRLPWELDTEQSTARQETWLLSFVDILALLLTLFVLLLAHQNHINVKHPSEPVTEVRLSPNFLALLTNAGARSPEATAAAGFAMPGPGLIAMPVAHESPSSVTETPPPSSRQAAPASGDQMATEADSAAATQTAPAAGNVPQPRREDEPEQAVNVQDQGTDTAAVAPSAPADNAPQEEVPPPTPAALQAAPMAAQKQFAASRQTADQLGRRLRASIPAEHVEVTSRPGAVNLEISDSILFTPASAALSPAGLALLEQLADILRTLPYSVSVEGHTDNVPIHTPRYPSNWELSSARAAMVTRKLIAQGVASDRLRAVGYGDTRPRSDNATAEDRAKNRRVTFVLHVDDPQ
jgi:chemotaxis protein MotB